MYSYYDRGIFLFITGSAALPQAVASVFEQRPAACQLRCKSTKPTQLFQMRTKKPCQIVIAKMKVISINREKLNCLYQQTRTKQV